MRLRLHHWILLAMLLGASVGLPLNVLADKGRIDAAWPQTVALYGKEVGDLFLRLLSMIVVPLILTSLVSGVTGTGSLKGLGRLGGTTLTYYIGTSLLAITTGIVLVNVIRPGQGADLANLQRIAETERAGGRRTPRVADAGYSHYYAACRYAVRNQADKAFACLDKAIVSRAGDADFATQILNEPDFENLRGDDRFGLAVEKAIQFGRGLLGGEAPQSLGRTMWNQLFNLVPSNPFNAMGDAGNRSILGVIFFALLFGVFITVVGGEAGALLTRIFNAAFEVMMKMTMFIIKAAPVGVLGFMLYASAGKGLGVFVSLGWYALTVFLGLCVHALVTLPLLLWLLARRSPWDYFKAVQPALLTAFSTASSNGTLPLTMTSVEKRAGVSNRISSFVLPLGATINMDGTALYEAVAVLFIAQAMGHDLGLAQQIIVAITALLASIGAAGIPHAGTVMMMVVLSAVGLPLDAVGLILAVDRILDMCRTSVNVWSDSTACAVVARLEPPEAGRSIA